MGAGGAHHRQSTSVSPTAKSFLPSFLPSSLSLHFFLPFSLSAYLPSCSRSYLLVYLDLHTINPPSLHGPAVQPASCSLTTREAASLYSFCSEYNDPSSTRSTAVLSHRHGLGHLLKK